MRRRISILLHILLLAIPATLWVLSYRSPIIFSLESDRGTSYFGLASVRGQSFFLRPAFLDELGFGWGLPPVPADMRLTAGSLAASGYLLDGWCANILKRCVLADGPHVPYLPTFGLVLPRRLTPIPPTFALPYWLPTLLLAALLARRVYRAFRARHQAPPGTVPCPKCHYDLRAHMPDATNSVLSTQSSSLPPRCPECGTPIPKA